MRTSRIRVLPENLTNQIAAGEVVERPASVIKELLENALDAGARRIRVETELGGRRLMLVEDDGAGMPREDAEIAFERHATSKITSLDDLHNIGTLGFRGEALASIGSVAKVALLTKSVDEKSATRLTVEGGVRSEAKDGSRPHGTTVEVRDLFFNTPARRKFLRSPATENYHITSIVTHYALANHKVAFTLTNNGREVIRASTAADLRERAFQIFGPDVVESLLPVSGGRELVAEVTGFVSAPRERRSSRDGQYFFVNGRYVKDRIISNGLSEGYRSVLPQGVYPVALLFIDVPKEEVDVNVHPAKTEVRFRRALAVREAVADAVNASLRQAGIGVGRTGTPNADPVGDRGVSGTEQLSRAASADTSGADARRKDAPVLAQQEFDLHEQPTENSAESLREAGAAPPASESPGFGEVSARAVEPDQEAPADANRIPATEEALRSAPPPFDSALSIARSIEIGEIDKTKIRPVGQLHDSFIIAVDEHGLLLIDQHVAHERILFEIFRQRERDSRRESQNLLIPETIDLSPAQAVAFDEISGDLEKAGFEVSRLSGGTIAVKSIPADLPAEVVPNLVKDLLETFDSENRGRAGAAMRDDIAASMACRAAVKINTRLTPEKMSWMTEKLLETTSPTTCPHGRPVVLRLSMRDIERKFHRT